MTETSTCLSPSCRATVEGIVPICPTCGKRMRTPKDTRRMGWFLLGVGVFLVALMGWVTWLMVPMLLDPGAAVSSGARFNGTPAQARVILMLFGSVIAFGVLTIVNGGWMIRTGMRSKALNIATIVLAIGLLLFGFYISGGLKP